MPTWDVTKRRSNLRRHDLDFADAEKVWDSFTITREDIRKGCGEPRRVTFGLLRDDVVVLMHSERGDDDHYISLRRAEPYEPRYYFETAKEQLR